VAALAARNRAPIIVTANNNTISTASGTPGTIMQATMAPLVRSAPIITWRRGSLSASPDSVTPPMNVGNTLETSP
jgi:hypothetical protein